MCFIESCTTPVAEQVMWPDSAQKGLLDTAGFTILAMDVLAKCVVEVENAHVV